MKPNKYLDLLSKEEKEKALNTLTCYREISISHQYGGYHYTTGHVLTAVYPSDFKFCGTVKDEDVYTEDELLLNYVNNFYSYPITYKGVRNYLILKKAQLKKLKLILVDGNIELEGYCG